MKEKIISGRIKAETAMEIQFLKHELGINQTAIIESAIHHLYKEIKEKKPSLSRLELFKSTGFLGSIKTESNLSECYKQKMDEYLKEKYDRS